MNDSVSRRSLVAAGPLALAACGRAEETYFGRTDPPQTKRLVYLFEAEPDSLDPALVTGRIDQLILSLFEGLTGVHPTTGTPIRLEYFAPNMPDCKLWFQVLREQWKAHLGVELVMVAVEFRVWIQSVHAGNFRHVAQWGSAASYVDPVWFLDVFSSPGGYGTSWTDPVYNQMLSQARAISDPALRIASLEQCERRLLQGMPIIPVCHDVYPKLTKPFVKGLGSNLLNREQLKYAWIDTEWRPS